ncbi:MAG: hypothetical protein Fur0016_13170 [Anaerolineales bacterium]
MARNLRFAWVILPYFAVAFGILTLRSAWGALIGFHLGLLPLLLTNRERIHPLLALVSMHLVLPFALLGLMTGLGLWLTWPLTGIPSDYPARVEALGLRKETWLLFIAYFTLVNPFLEETYWRGILGSESHLPQPVDFLFAGYHLVILALFAWPSWVVIGFFILIGASWFWRQLARRAKSLLPAVLFHATADASILLVLYLKTVQ